MKKINFSLLKLVELLNDQAYHDGNSIGAQLNLTRAAVWKLIKKLEAYQISVQSIKGKGYCLKEPLILLDPRKINTLLKDKSIEIKVVENIDSTNEYLKKHAKENKKIIVCLAEMQTQGRGRLNRQWYSPFGRNIYLSILFPLQKDISELAGLSLVVGLAVCQALTVQCQLENSFFVKWPNDVIANQQKIAGNLIEIQAESHGACNVIIGIGINVNMQQVSKQQIDQPWTSLQQLTGKYYDRNVLCAVLLENLIHYLQRFNNAGLADFLEEWQTRDYLFNQSVQLLSNKAVVIGKGAGINHQGHLLLTLADQSSQAFAAGDTTLLKN